MIQDDLHLVNTLRGLLAQAPALTAAQLGKATGKSQSSISKALISLGDEVLKLGAARSTRYALTQDILGLAASQALHETGEAGDIRARGTLTFLKSNRVHVRGEAPFESLSDGRLPWFLTPLQPQGFLGRELARLRPDFPTEPDDWSLAQVLYMAANHQTDPPGAFELGRVMGEVIPEAPHDIAARLVHYDALTASINSRLPAGSSAGGEQPKFTTTVPADGHPLHAKHCIVKFTPPRGTPFGERWHDLLQLEHLAGEVLRQHGIAAAQTQLLHSPQRSYLESSRFDRIGLVGKRHVVAASAIHDEFVKAPRQHWVATCAALAANHLLPAEDLNAVVLTYLFGQYIGNTDMHFGNLSFFTGDIGGHLLGGKQQAPFRVTPVYDMLPMMWRPHIHSGLLDLDPVRPQLQPAGYGEQAVVARNMAIDYWQQAAALANLSPAMRTACLKNAVRLQRNFADGD